LWLIIDKFIKAWYSRLLKTKNTGGLRKEQIKMKVMHFEIQIEGWKKHRFITTSQTAPYLMFFHIGGCPAQSLCEQCKLRIQFVKRRSNEMGIQCDEVVSESGYVCFGLVFAEIEWNNPEPFLEKLFEARVVIVHMWQSHTKKGGDIADPPNL
jgi:hypothetical protein